MYHEIDRPVAMHRYSYPSRVYRDFFSISPNDYQAIIRFFEQNEEAIQQLTWDENLELLAAYAGALFAVGEYRKHLLLVDVLIEAALDGGSAALLPFGQLLFRKAASYYQVAAYEQAGHVLKELIRIHPDHEDARLFLLKVTKKEQHRLRGYYLATAIILAASGGLLYSAELLFVRPFYTMHAPKVEQLRLLMFVGSLLAWIGGGVYIYLKSHSKVNAFVRAQKERKQKMAAKGVE